MFTTWLYFIAGRPYAPDHKRYYGRFRNAQICITFEILSYLDLGISLLKFSRNNWYLFQTFQLALFHDFFIWVIKV